MSFALRFLRREIRMCVGMCVCACVCVWDPSQFLRTLSKRLSNHEFRSTTKTAVQVFRGKSADNQSLQPLPPIHSQRFRSASQASSLAVEFRATLMEGPPFRFM